MIRVAIDSNVLIYAEFEPDSEKGIRSTELILHAARDGVIPAQVLGEFLRFVQRRVPASFEEAVRQISLYQSVFLTPPTTDAIINKASELARTSHATVGWRGVCGIGTGRRQDTADRRYARRADYRRPAPDEPFAAANVKPIDDLLAG